MERLDMSEEGGFGISLAEKFFGVLILVVGALAMYYLLTSLVEFGSFAGFFGFLDAILIGLGLLLITAKTE
ncbi:MAG: hypothetical protein WBV70_07365 [Candidatus Bathyarchaeia archaeon]|jgi:hypothetical protein